MPSIHDVAKYILTQKGEMTTMKLQKLCYYSQAWSLVWDEDPVFEDKIEAWANGPVSPALFKEHRGQFKVSDNSRGDISKLSPVNLETIDSVLKYYGDKSGVWLSDLTHKEQPWLTAREGLLETERGNREITLGSMSQYYGNL